MDNKFSVIVPTYSGEETISKCLESALSQNNKNYEMVIVVDGPNYNLLSICNKFKKRFLKNNIPIKIKQFKKNKGRFKARLEGAQLASTDQLLFLDDRIQFGNNYFDTLIKTNNKVVIPNVYEEKANNIISQCMHLLRKVIYGEKQFGTDFDSYWIDERNFEASPKGTTSLWIKKEIFLNACSVLMGHAETKYINEDIKLFRIIVSGGDKIFRSGESKIYYFPREGIVEELKHLYHRGPRFVDYYLKKDTRFFVPLVLFYLTPLGVFLLFIINTDILLVVSGLSILIIISIAMYLTRFSIRTPLMAIALVLIGLSFGMGLIKGLWIKLRGNLTKTSY